MNVLNVLIWLNLGLFAGWIAGEVMRARGYGMVVVILTGMLGALVGGWAGTALFGSDAAAVDLLTSVPAVFGAIALTTVVWTVAPRRRSV